MCNFLWKNLTDERILHPKRFGCWKCHFAEQPIAQVPDHICEPFGEDNYTAGIFFNLSKVFDALDHTKLLKKAEIWRRNYRFRSYLAKRNQLLLILNFRKTRVRYQLPVSVVQQVGRLCECLKFSTKKAD